MNYWQKLSIRIGWIFPAFLMVIICFFVTLTVVWHIVEGYRNNFYEHQQRSFAEQRANEEKLQIRLQREKGIRRYETLRSYGLFEAVDRIGQIDQLESSALQSSVAYIDFEFNDELSMKKNVNFDNLDTKFWQIRSDSVTVKLKLLHEEILLNFLAELQKKGQYSIRLRSCLINRLPFQAKENLDAVCELEWITLQPKNFADEADQQ